MTPEKIKEVLEKHAKWLREEADGKRANLWGANLWGADLEGTNLRGTNLEGTNLEGANLQGANLQGANLRGANLRGANLWGANLWGANLWGANLWGANLRCFGNMKEIRTLQIGAWEIAYTSDTLQIGCQSHAIDKWRKWNTEAGRKWVEQMDSKALEWVDRNLGLVLQIIDVNPATPTGHERATGEDRG